METKKYTQFGTFSVAILLPLLLLFMGMLIKWGLSSGPESVLFLPLTLVFLICLLTSYKLTITVDNTHVSFKLGIGLFGKSYKISDIKSCEPVRNSPLYGIGIRMMLNGWLYNVSGLKAIELQFNNRSSVVRIGTDQPEEISRLIQRLIAKKIPQDMTNSERKRSINPLWIIALITLIIPVGLIVSGNQDTKVLVENYQIVIKGFYGVTIPFNDLMQIDTVSLLPRIASRTNGYAFQKTKTGNFRLADGSDVKLFVKTGSPPFIFIKSKTEKPIYLNFEDKQKTLRLYNEIKGKKQF